MNSSKLFLFFISLVLGGAGAWLISQYGTKLGLLDRPNARSSHQNAVPKGGGIGILITFIVVSILIGIPKSFWMPASFLSLVSLFGDRFHISPYVRLLFQFATAIILLAGVWGKDPHPALSYLLIWPLAIFIVATANYYNFMDGINGIAGLTGVVGFGLLSFFAYLRGANIIMMLSISLSLSCLGFLPFNVPKAKVFMGDVGSILLGFVFASMVIILADKPSDIIILVCFLFPFYTDEIVTLVERLKDREKLTKPHRGHLYQVLANECGLDHWKVSLGYSLFQLTVGICVWGVASYHIIYSILTLMAFLCIFVIANYKVKKIYQNIP